MTFYNEIQKHPWEDVKEQIYAKTEADVQAALRKKKLTIEDFKALISPAAAPHLEEMAQLSQHYTLERYGKTISMFIPLYLTNSCTNSCVYCGFNRHNKMKRTILTEEEIVNEYKAIKKLAPFDNLLLVTGENPAKAGVEYLKRAIELAKPYFNSVQIEVMPLDMPDYVYLAQQGLNGVICFQETYHEERYKVYHPQGMKSNFRWRLEGFDRMGQAELHKIGLGILIGLEDWRTDVAFMAIHLNYLQKRYWKTKFSINFPRMRAAKNGGFQPNIIMNDKELAQITFAMRLFDHDVDLSMSTRECPDFRNHMATLGITTMSAASQTEPGGYASYPKALEQFQISDERTANQVDQDLRAMDRIPIYKDWDLAFNTFTSKLH